MHRAVRLYAGPEREHIINKTRLVSGLIEPLNHAQLFRLILLGPQLFVP
jgi:hypothetical protein